MKKIVKIVMVLVLGFAMLHQKAAARAYTPRDANDRLMTLLLDYTITLDTVKQFFIDNKDVNINVAVHTYNGSKTTLLHIIISECLRKRKGVKDEVKDITEYLIAKGAKINAADDKGNTPLHQSAYSGCTDMVKYLIEKGASTTVTNKNGQTPLQYLQQRIPYVNTRSLLYQNLLNLEKYLKSIEAK